MPVATTDTVDRIGRKIGRKAPQLIVNLNGKGRDMPYTIKNDIKIRVMAQKPNGNSEKNSANKYLPSEIP
jgi:hypothetical protein